MESLDGYESLVCFEIKNLASIFLKGAGEFYPFAMSIDKSKQLYSIAAALDGEEYPTSQSLVDILEKSIPQDITEGKYLLGGICIDIFIHENINGVQIKKNAIEIRFIGEKYHNKVQIYYKLLPEGDVLFEYK